MGALHIGNNEISIGTSVVTFKLIEGGVDVEENCDYNFGEVLTIKELGELINELTRWHNILSTPTKQ